VLDMSRSGNLDIIFKNMGKDKATKTLAKSLYRELIHNGFKNKDIINLSKNILDHMAQEMNKEASEVSNKKDRLLIS